MSRAFTVCERETRIAIKEGKRTVAYVQMAADDEETAKLFAAAPEFLAVVRAFMAAVEMRGAQSFIAIAEAKVAARAALAKVQP